MSIGLALGLCAALAWGFTDVASAVAGRRIGSLRLLVGTQFTGLAWLLLLAALLPADFAADPWPAVTSGVVIGAIAALAYLAFFTALTIGPISVVSPVIAAYGGLTVVLAVGFRGETLSTTQALGALLATLGVVLTGVAFEGRLRDTRLVGPGVAFAVVTLVLFAVLSVALAGPIKEHGWLPVALGSRAATTATSVLLLAIGLTRRGGPLGRALPADLLFGRLSVALVVVAGTLDVAGYVAYTIGLEVAPTWLIGLASSFAPAITIVVAVAAMGERPKRVQWLGLGVIAAGMVAVALP